MINKFLLSIAVYAIFSFQVLASEDRALFWRADSSEATVYLLGSIHFADDSFYPLRAEIEKAFDASETLVVEVDVTSPDTAADYQRLMKNEGQYTGDETLKDHLSQETYKELQTYLKKWGIPSSLVEKQKPGIVVLSLAVIQMQQLGLDPNKGIDQYFLNKASKHKKILALETLEDQLRIFLDIEDADLLFKDLFYSFELVEKEMDALISAWKQGNEESMYKLLVDDILNENAAIRSLYETLYFQRNVKMANLIKGYLKQKGQYFVVVGAGHLVGDKGIVQLLQNAGYRLTRL